MGDHHADKSPEGQHERERLEALGGVEVSDDGYLHGRIGVSRALGDFTWENGQWGSKCRGLLCDPEITEQEIPDDAEFLLLGCDGIFEKMTATEVGQVCRRALRRRPKEPQAAADAVVKTAHKLKGSDNLSAV